MGTKLLHQTSRWATTSCNPPPPAELASALPQALQHKLKAEAEQRIDEAHAALQSHLHSSDSAQDKLKEAERQRRALEGRISEVIIY